MLLFLFKLIYCSQINSFNYFHDTDDLDFELQSDFRLLAPDIFVPIPLRNPEYYLGSSEFTYMVNSFLIIYNIQELGKLLLKLRNRINNLNNLIQYDNFYDRTVVQLINTFNNLCSFLYQSTTTNR